MAIQDAVEATHRIGTVARATGFSVFKIKELDAAVQPLRDAAGHRRYGPQHIARLRLLLLGQRPTPR